ncbi:hypothetical protein DPMN_146119 [Dreissena polymorpha]|uniref:Uncharacterized protein n=1 Tax=Dreissena polymorpha TaxID=45954 RepID=A0A9D4J208_DREPO|nr:hypothetical protein DPMN_146119 [Dreissena polymorpha]
MEARSCTCQFVQIVYRNGLSKPQRGVEQFRICPMGPESSVGIHVFRQHSVFSFRRADVCPQDQRLEL